MFKLARWKEVWGDDRATYASKAMHWVGEKLILSIKTCGLPDDFWWDQEDRGVLKGEETSDPRYQRLQVRTDDFRRYLCFGVARFLPMAIPVLAVPVLLMGYLFAFVMGPKSLHGDAPLPGMETAGLAADAPANMSDSELTQAIQKMDEAGKTKETLTDEELAIIVEAQRRQL